MISAIYYADTGSKRYSAAFAITGRIAGVHPYFFFPASYPVYKPDGWRWNSYFLVRMAREEKIKITINWPKKLQTPLL